MLLLGALLVYLFCIAADALPVVPSIPYPGDEWNFLLLGVIMMIGMGAIVACVRCRRQKRGFEEFKNEATKATRTSTTVEAIRTEFPIFQALSTPSSPQFQQLDNASSRDSREHVDQVDILDELAPASYTKVFMCQEQSVFTGSEKESYQEKVQSPLLEETIVLTFDSSEPHEKPHIYQQLTAMEAESSDSGSSQLAQQDDEAEYNSSLEQALRELDIAIGDNDDQVEDSEEADGKEYEAGNGSEDTEGHFENVIKQLFLENMNMLSTFSPVESAESLDHRVIDETGDTNELFEQRVDEMQMEGEKEEEGQVISDIVNSLIEDCCSQVTVVGERLNVTDVRPPESDGMKDVLSEEQFFFENLPAICQSTPSVRDKNADRVFLAGGVRPKKSLLFDEETLSPEENATFAVAKSFAEEERQPSDGIPRVTVCQERDLGEGEVTFEVVTATASATGGGSEHQTKYLKDGNATITPVNTPIEVNYEDAENDDKDGGEMTFTKEGGDSPKNSIKVGGGGGWFLHPQEPLTVGDETFDFDNLPPPPPPLELDINDYDIGGFGGEDLDNEDDDYASNRANMDFDALRKQLADLLPHAQGAPALDDEGAVGGSCESGMPLNVLEAMLNNIDPSPVAVPEVQSLKRSLSPIMEESEEENTTIKTSILNDTKNLDSTSTGCIETLSEAVMGVTRTLMASNDTLFNFEDTLGDREDLTPTPMAGGTFTTAKSPVNGTFIMGDSSTAMVDSTFVMEEQQPKGSRGTMTLSLDLSAVRADTYSNALDVTSPEQLRTFSEDITSVEHVSGSDASGKDPDGTYTTNTIEMETCISLNKDEAEECDVVEDLEKDDRISDDSEESKVSTRRISAVSDELGEGSEGKEESVENGGVMTEGLEIAGPDVDPVEQTKLFLAREIDHSRWHKVSSNCVDAGVFHVTAVEHVNPVLEVAFEKFLTSEKSSLPEDDSNNNVTFDLNENCDTVEHLHLSGEEDPWLAAPRNGGEAEEEDEMLTVFNCDWDKESADDSDNNADLTDQEEEEDGASVESESDDSSEEFMYVQGNSLTNKTGITNGEVHAVWDSHVDQIPIARKEESTFETVAEEEEGECEEEGASDADGEFIPSCWSSSAKPSRSAMKSPDKSSSDEDSKDEKRRARNVAFKKQQYHSVYEYPREINPLSPSLSEPTFSVNFRDQASPHAQSAIGDIDGFMISSSTRPFQSNQCHTWPTESDFSWSQHLPSEDNVSPLKSTEGTIVYSEIPIEWPRKVIVEADGDDSGSESSNQVLRPDSGVGESAEFLNDATSLGELCHTKASLRLPLINPPATLIGGCTPQKKEEEIHGEDQDQELEESSDENQVLPTPSCTGSMDSLSSSSCSDRQMVSFTFGKVTPQSSVDETSRVSNGRIVDINKLTTLADPDSDHRVLVERNGLLLSEKCGNQRSRISDSTSTDEDSGIENISRKVK